MNVRLLSALALNNNACPQMFSVSVKPIMHQLMDHSASWSCFSAFGLDCLLYAFQYRILYLYLQCLGVIEQMERYRILSIKGRVLRFK